MAFVNIKQKSDLVNLQKKIQKSFLNEKLGDQQVYQENLKRLQPLIEPIKNITKQQKEIMLQSQSAAALPAITMSPTPLAIQDIPASPIPEIASLNLGSISGKYISEIYKALEYDNAYGIKYVGGSDFKIGNTLVKINNNNIEVEGKSYTGTEGLWKLLTLKNPGNVSITDLDTYKEIMIKTKAFLKEDGTVKSNRGNKYATIIKPIYNEYNLMKELKSTMKEVKEKKNAIREKRRSLKSESDVGKDILGTGFKFISSDPNELLNRHKILFLQMQAGNTNVFNELQAINDQLYKLNIFDKEMIELLNIFLSL